MGDGKEKLVVEVIAAHNLMPKDGEGSSSPFVEVEFEKQILRTQVKYKDLNPIWNEKLVFDVPDTAELPYKHIEVNVFNERRSSNSRNFLGKVRAPCSQLCKKEGEATAQLYTLEKRSLFSHIRGEISLKLFVSTTEEVVKKGGFVSSLTPSSAFSKKNKKLQQQSPVMQVQQQHFGHQDMMSKPTHQQQSQNHMKPMEPNPGELKPVVITTAPRPVIPGARGGPTFGGGGGGGVYVNGSGEFSLKETSPHLGGGFLNKDKTSSTYDRSLMRQCRQ